MYRFHFKNSTTQNLTDEPVYQDEKEREEDEACVPHPDCPVDGRDAEEHKDDGFRSIGKNLHGMSDCVDRILVHVCIDVFLTTYTTEDNPVKQIHKNKLCICPLCFVVYISFYDTDTEMVKQIEFLSWSTNERMADRESISAVR